MWNFLKDVQELRLQFSYYLSLIVGELYTSEYILGILYPKVKVKYPNDPAFSPFGGIGIDMQPARDNDTRISSLIFTLASSFQLCECESHDLQA